MSAYHVVLVHFLHSSLLNCLRVLASNQFHVGNYSSVIIVEWVLHKAVVVIQVK